MADLSRLGTVRHHVQLESLEDDTGLDLGAIDFAETDVLFTESASKRSA